MKTLVYGKRLLALITIWTVGLVPLVAQTRVTMPKNKYKVQDDIKIGRNASSQVTRQFPLLNDSQTERYVESVGARLVAAIPPEIGRAHV